MNTSQNPSAVRSKSEITQALLTLMHKHPYEEITVKQIILEARLARKTFYRNFDSKDDVLFSYMQGILKEYFDTVNEARSDVLTSVFAFADKHRDFLLLLDKNDMLYVALQYINRYIPALRSSSDLRLNSSVELFRGLDEEYLLMLNIGAMWSVVALWTHRGMTDPPEKVRSEIYEYLNRLKNTGTAFATGR